MTGAEIALLAVAAAGTAVAAQSSSNQQKAASNASSDAAKRQGELETAATERMANEESEANAIDTRNKAQQRQRARSVGAGGRSDTILTGPDGVAAPDEGSKTLLGL